MKQTKVIIVSIMLLGLLAACTFPSVSSNTLDGSTWKLVSYLGSQGQTINALVDANATLTFEEEQVNGGTGCNLFFAGYAQKVESLTLDGIGNTEMACEEQRMAQEASFLAALRQVTAYRINGDQLELLDAIGNVQLTFSALEPLSLVGTAWVMSAVPNGADWVSSPVEGVEVTALFSADGSVSGNSGCNSYSGSYEIHGEKIEISSLISTLMACLDAGAMEQESAYFQALEQAATYQLSYSSLQIFNAEGALLVAFNQK